MLSHRTAMLGVAFTVATLSAHIQAAEIGNILPLGDSITRGSADPPIPGGYRGRLYENLVAAGHSFTFVGTQTDNSTPSLDDAGQAHHEGHGSYTIAAIDAGLDGYLAAVPTPGYVLLMIGTNDFIGGPGEDTAIDRLDTLVTHITDRLPDAHLIVSNLMVRGEPDVEARIQTLFNSLIPGLVSDHVAAGKKVSFVDMHSVLTVADLGDGDNCHPNRIGYSKMGDAWFGAIKAVPEPSSRILLGTALLGLLAYTRQMRK